MHVLAGKSALKALRAIRYRQLGIAIPEATLASRIVQLHDERPSNPAPHKWEEQAPARSLEESGFDFEAIEANAYVDFWRLGDLGPITADEPLELAVFDRSHRTMRKKLRTRELPRSLPEDALVQVDPSLYFVCPELIVLQMTARLDIPQLVQLIMELCGRYALAPTESIQGRSQYQIPPVTTINRIERYASLVRARGGAKKLQQALGLALEGSASPGETKVAMMMSFPPELGGYGFPKPMLNASVTVPESELGRVAGDRYELDAFWQDAHTDLEYESTEYHLDPLSAASLVAARDRDPNADPEAVVRRRLLIAKADADRRRLRDIQYLGIQVVPVTSFDLGDVRRMDQVAYALAASSLPNKHDDFDKWADHLEERSYTNLRRSLLKDTDNAI